MQRRMQRRAAMIEARRAAAQREPPEVAAPQEAPAAAAALPPPDDVAEKLHALTKEVAILRNRLESLATTSVDARDMALQTHASVDGKNVPWYRSPPQTVEDAANSKVGTLEQGEVCRLAYPQVSGVGGALFMRLLYVDGETGSIDTSWVPVSGPTSEEATEAIGETEFFDEFH